MGPPDLILAFLTKNFNRVLSDEDKEAILQEYPKPNCPAMEVPCLDNNVKVKRKGMDPKFGAKKNMFRIQEQSLEVGGPLTCLLANLVNPVEVDREAIIQVVQRALVLLGSVSHSISLERRKIAWARINPDLKSLALEDYPDRQNQLFGPGYTWSWTKPLQR